MRVLVLSITAGQGHNSTAKALCDYLDGLGAETQILDTFAYLNQLLGDTVSKGYLLSVENLRHIYARVYKLLERRKKNGDRLSATRLTYMLFIRKMKKYIDEYDPDVIVCTHIFSAIIVDILKQRHNIRAETIGIVTDFAFHPYWEEGIHLEYVVVADEQMRLQARRKGYHDEQILPLGIPINPKFSRRTEKREALLSLGLDPDKKTLLMMSGSMGYGNLEETVLELDALKEDFQMLIVCGNNKAAKESIDKLELHKPVINFGFTTNVDLLMDAADCIISKPGGLTTSEALAKKLPMIIVNPIPGQEERNVEFLLNNGAAVTVNDNYSIADLVYVLFHTPGKLAAMEQSAAVISKPNSTRDLCEFIMSMKPMPSAEFKSHEAAVKEEKTKRLKRAGRSGKHAAAGTAGESGRVPDEKDASDASEASETSETSDKKETVLQK